MNVNRRKVLAMLREDFGAGYHPIRSIAQIAHNEDNPVDVRLRAHSEVAQYILPKLRSVEVTGEDGGPVAISFEWGKPHD